MRNSNIGFFGAASHSPVAKTLSLAFLLSLVQETVADNLRKSGKGSGDDVGGQIVVWICVVALIGFCAFIGGCRPRDNCTRCDCNGV